MRETRQKIKHLAKNSMAGRFFSVLVIMGLQYLTSALLVRVFSMLGTNLRPEATFELFGLTVNYISISFGVLAALFFAPLELGICEYLLCLVRKKEVHFADAFSWYGDFSKIAKSVPYGIWSVFTAVFQVALFDFPMAYIQGQLEIVLKDIQEQSTAGAELIIPHYGLMNGKGILIAVAAMLLIALLGTLFVAVKFFYVDTKKIFFSVFSSPSLMIRHIWSYILFVLSFAGFYFGTIFTFGLLGIYLLPYFGVSQVAYIEYVRAKAKFDGKGQLWV
jgi:hypothetical protein